ncbi:TorA maturation chaperone TorD [Trueperella bonasi]|uniref:TorA maturation chaperone TorD n=1 Tax=Trueperella bonasi TaxID=312286 RepID=A0ABT9NI85_9ACTO|nr:molecular chaperone TorD family protein [Trueperella bonasi]MDP9806523.1 TorA maturation chaperone TorD [Trueperella bonasi]
MDDLDALAAAFLTLGRLHLDAPQEETITQLSQMYQEWPLPLDGETATGIEQWERSFSEGETAQELRTDLNDLYGRTARAKVPPFESVHRGRDGLVFDEETLQVRQEYKQLGLQAPNLHKEPDDHIGLEFDFVSQGLVRALTALEHHAPRDAERYVAIVHRFYSHHLALWAPDMLATAREAAQTHFYRGVMSLSLGALEQLVEVLEIATEQ